MHDSSVSGAPRTAELLALVGRLAEPGERQQAATALARLLGGEELLLFAPDPELEVALPAPGLRQVLRGAGEWRAFLAECARAGEAAATVPGPDGDPALVHGVSLPDGVAAVLVKPDADAAGPGALRPLLPLLGAVFRAERKVASDEVRARSAADAMERGRTLNRALQQMRERLESALVEADRARQSARERAEQAESLAAELQSKADQLQQQAVELELLNNQLAARSEEAERARAAADSANRAKSEFLATMSHELRTPINAVIGYAELLHLGISGPVTREQQDYLDRIRTSSAHLISLINDVLDLAKVEAGHMVVEHHHEPVVDVVAEAINLAEVQSVARRISLESRCDDRRLVYVGDRDRVRQILINLLSNAVKFTEPGGAVTVRCQMTECADEEAQLAGEGPWTCIAVEDTGIGMAPDELPRIFQPFVQADSGPTRTRGGTGLGLTISRQLARLMGGDLTVFSEKGRGSRFTLWLPAVRPAAGTIDPAIRVEPADQGGVPPEGLVRVGEHIQANLTAIVAALAERIRSDPELSALPGDQERDTLEQVPLFVADLASLLIKLGRSGGDSGLLWRGSEIQRLIAEEHGAERARQGWTSDALRREFVLLRRELERVVQEVSSGSPPLETDGVTHVIDGLLRKAEYASLRSLRALDLSGPA